MGDDFRQYPDLLGALDIKESPDHNDAIQVLKDISKEMGSNTLSSEDKDRDAVLQCWVMLSKALEREEITDERIRMVFHNIRCVPNNQEVLEKPSFMFFEDSLIPTDNFTVLSNNLIERIGCVYRAMEAAGVRPISDVVRGIVDEPVNPQEDEELKEIVKKRARLVKHVSNNAIQLGNINFIRVEELKVRWCMRDVIFADIFNRNHSNQSEPTSAHLDCDKDILYFTLEGGARLWPAIARELTKAIAPGKEISSNAALAIMTILQANNYDDAALQLKEAGINIPEELGKLESTGAIAESLGEASPSDVDQESPPPAEELTSDGVAGETSPIKRNEPPESDPTPWDDEDNTYTEPGSDGDAGTRDRRQTPRTPRGRGGPPFISYVGAHPDEKEPSPEGSEEAARKSELEESAIAFILKQERRERWERTPTHNPGYDLEKIDHNGVISLCEVKAMTGTWQDRPVGLTHTQFEMAQECGAAYWLYVVENADTDCPSIVKIKDPAGQARTFTFDHGWREIAVVDDTGHWPLTTDH